ncbi:MAG: HisA/HisF-related TIM barrel protein [Tsuneonella sp.]
MLKRLIGVITVKDGWAVQSLGYSRHLPLGRPEIIAENFDRWQVDEIVVLAIDRTLSGAEPDFATMERIASRRIMTPLCYAGGVRGAEDAVALVRAGADRIALDALFQDDPTACRAIAAAIGRQATIRICPAHRDEDGGVVAYDYRTKTTLGKLADVAREHEDTFSELMVVDWRHEGSLGGFDMGLIAPLEQSGLQIIAFGGISTKPQVTALMGTECVSAVAVGNSLSYRELAPRQLVTVTEVDKAREVSFGDVTRGAREW